MISQKSSQSTARSLRFRQTLVTEIISRASAKKRLLISPLSRKRGAEDSPRFRSGEIRSQCSRLLTQTISRICKSEYVTGFRTLWRLRESRYRVRKAIPRVATPDKTRSRGNAASTESEEERREAGQGLAPARIEH